MTNQPMIAGLRRLLCCTLLLVLGSCGHESGKKDGKDGSHGAVPVPANERRVDSRPLPMAQPVDYWEAGAAARKVDAATIALHDGVLVDLGEEWTPYLFTDRGNAAEAPKPNKYRTTYMALAQEHFPKDYQGDRARKDKYLELYGIMPTLSVLRKRMEKVSQLACAEKLDLTPFTAFDGYVTYSSLERGKREATEVALGDHLVPKLLAKYNVATIDEVDLGKLDTRDQRVIDTWKKAGPRVHAIRAAQDRMRCEGFVEPGGRIIPGVLDWVMQNALNEFERRHRIYGWGVVGGDTLVALRRTPMENERLAVIRILTERAMHAAGVIEDGSIPPPKGQTTRTFKGANDSDYPIPNLEKELQDNLIAAFGLQTPESTLAWLKGLGDLRHEHLVAFKAAKLPEYYSGDMHLEVEIDRGDIWYEFPYGYEGKEAPQPVERRPRLTIFTEYNGQRIALARFGTTIGGWRTESVDGVLMWKYKNSPPGPVIWDRIVAAPVWIPPETTPPKALLVKARDGSWQINYHETGPSYASAYGLVAAYHKKYRHDATGDIVLGGDDGIRTHGSVDYMSIMRRNSHGCHRLLNHIAVRLMSFVLAHRPHRRVGQANLVYEFPFEYEQEPFLLTLDTGGYIFMLNEPLHVNVLEGRIRGKLKQPIEVPLPKYDETLHAYVLPDGTGVSVAPDGTMTQVPLPLVDGGVPEPIGDNAAIIRPAPPPPPAAPPQGTTIPAAVQPAGEDFGTPD